MELHIVSTGSKGNCAVLKHDGRMLMLDCGVPAQAIYRAVNFNMAVLDACLVGHEHADHAKSLSFLQSQYVRIGIPEGGRAQRFRDWGVMPFSLEHDTDNVGYIIQHRQLLEDKLCYISDTGYVRYSPAGISHMLIECSYIDRLLDANKDALDERYLRMKRSHMSLERVVSYLSKIDRSQLKTVVLLHLSAANSDASEMVDAVSSATGVRVYAAENGMTIDLSDCPF